MKHVDTKIEKAKDKTWSVTLKFEDKEGYFTTVEKSGFLNFCDAKKAADSKISEKLEQE